MVPTDIKGIEHKESRLVHFLEEARQIPARRYVGNVEFGNIISLTAQDGDRGHMFTVSTTPFTEEILYGYYGSEDGVVKVKTRKEESIRVGQIYKEIFGNNYFFSVSGPFCVLL